MCRICEYGFIQNTSNEVKPSNMEVLLDDLNFGHIYSKDTNTYAPDFLK